MSDPTILVAGGRRGRGRPPLSPSGRSTSVTIRVPQETFDRVCSEAWRKYVSVPEFIRQAVDRAITAK